MKGTRIMVAVTLTLLLCFALAPMASGAERGRTVRQPGPVGASPDAMLRLSKMYTTAQLQQGVYVGTDFCLACHKSMGSYKGTNHASFLRRPMTQYALQPGMGVIADYDHNGVEDFIQGVDFNAVSTTAFDKYKPNAPKLSVEAGQYYVTVGTMKMPLIFTVAGARNGTDQRFVVRIPVVDTPNKLSISPYFAPIQYSPKTGWSAYSPANWYDSTNAPKFAAGIGSAALATMGGNHASGCARSHSTGTQSISKTASGEWLWQGYPQILYNPDDPSAIDYNVDGMMEQMNIGCEDCHGAGSRHIIAAGDPAKIVNPAKLSKLASSEICGSCHVTGKSVPGGVFNFPYNDATNTNWTPVDAANGVSLETFYTDAATLYPDGKHQNGGRPYHDFKLGGKLNFAAHPIGCIDCHDPHQEGEGRLIRDTYTSRDGLVIPTSAEDNSLCLTCHATHGEFAAITAKDVFDSRTDAAALDKIAKTVEEHTHHPYAPERMMGLSRCIDCHMAVSHSFDAIGPEETLKYQDKGGMANSCAAGCHNNRVDVFNIGVKGTQSGWANTFDKTLSNALKAYYGEGGAWWDTKK